MYEYTSRVHVWWKPDKQRHAALTCIINAILRYRLFHELQMALIMSSYTTTSVNTVCANSRPGPDTSPANGRCQDALWRHRHWRSPEHWQTNRHRHSVVDSSRHWLQISPDAACDSGSERAPTQHATSTRIERLGCWVLSPPPPPPTPVEQEIVAIMATGCRKTVWRKHGSTYPPGVDDVQQWRTDDARNDVTQQEDHDVFPAQQLTSIVVIVISEMVEHALIWSQYIDTQHATTNYTAAVMPVQNSNYHKKCSYMYVCAYFLQSIKSSQSWVACLAHHMLTFGTM